MSAATAEAPVARAATLREQLADARREKALAMASAEWTDEVRGGHDRKIIDQAIGWLASTGRPFSANDMREELEDVRQPLIGARFYAAAVRGDIKKTGKRVTSTKKNTHAKPVDQWVTTRPPAVVDENQDALFDLDGEAMPA